LSRPILDLPPAAVDGALVRLVSDGVMTSVEQWMGPERGWEATTSTMVDEVMRGPTASPATLKMFGYPVPASEARHGQ
jgi:hypothetical protein